jgi:rubrerythrin
MKKLNKSIKKDIRENLRDEKMAIKGYGKAAKRATKAGQPKVAKLFRHIQKDEREHRKELSKVKIIK